MSEFTEFVDLAAERLGGCVVMANDEFFAPKENLLKHAKPVFIEGKYTDRGKWMDGWETRRRRTPGYDWCIVRLGLPGIVRGVVVDTSFFTGNYPARFSLEGCDVDGSAPYRDEKKKLAAALTRWEEILPETALQRRLRKSGGGDTCGAFYARAIQDLSGWRRGAIAIVWRGGAECAGNCETRTRFGGGGKWRAGDCDERSILQRAAEHADAGTQQDYE